MPEESSVDIYKRILAYLKPHKKKFFLALGCMVLYGATDGIIPFLIKDVLDKIFAAQDKKMLYILPVALIVFAIFRGVFGFLQQYLSAKVGHSIIQDIRNDIAKKLLKQSPGFFSNQQTGALVSRMTNDTIFVRQALTNSTAALIRDVVRIIALTTAAISLDPLLGSAALVVVPLAVYPIIKFGKKVRKLSRSGQDQFGSLTALLQETIVGHKVVQAFNLEKHLGKRFADENAKLTKTFIKSERYGALSAPTNEVLASFAIAGIILYGGFSVLSGVRTQGEFIAFLIAIFLMYDPFL